MPPIVYKYTQVQSGERAFAGQALKAGESFFNIITKIEAGDTPNPTVETMKKIADALEVTIDDLIK